MNYPFINNKIVNSIPRIIVSGMRGGSGKTILALSLITLFRNKGFQVVPFKKGPDYIDAGWLSKAADNPCYNLDLFMMSPEQALKSFLMHMLTPSPSSPCMAIIEGNRGLYDGVDHEGTYSTAELAKHLKSPVILSVDCTKATNTISAMVLGCQNMDSLVSLRGVVLNQIATHRQESLVRKAIEKRCGLPVLGAIPRLKKDPFPERHMGLTPFHEHREIEGSLRVVEEIGSRYLDAEEILKVAENAGPLPLAYSRKGREDRRRTTDDGLRIGVIRDTAFQFYYQENFEELEKRGAHIVEVSPLKESSLPDIDTLYIGGGFPETHSIALAKNNAFKISLSNAVEMGLPVYAECGGLMYLGKSIILNNKTYPMSGILPVVFALGKKPSAHGYTTVEVIKENPFYPVKTVLKGHEFHYSRVHEIDVDDTYMAFKVRRGKGIINNKDGMCRNNVFATYTHLHAIGSPEWADGMIAAAQRFRSTRF